MGCNYDYIGCTMPLPDMDGRNPVFDFQSKDLIQDMQRIVISPDGKMWHLVIDYSDGAYSTGEYKRYDFNGKFQMYGNYDGYYIEWYTYECVAEGGLIIDIELIEKKKTLNPRYQKNPAHPNNNDEDIL